MRVKSDIFALLPMLLVLLCLNACAEAPSYNKPEAINVDARLIQSADQIHSDMTTLSSLLIPRVAPQPHYDAPRKGPLSTLLDMSWSGDVAHALKYVADQIGFRLAISGLRSSDTLFVTLESHSVSAFRILEDIGAQLGDRANLDINEKQRVITLDYLRASTAIVVPEYREISGYVAPDPVRHRYRKKKRRVVKPPEKRSSPVTGSPLHSSNEKKPGYDLETVYLSDSAG